MVWVSLVGCVVWSCGEKGVGVIWCFLYGAGRVKNENVCEKGGGYGLTSVH